MKLFGLFLCVFVFLRQVIGHGALSFPKARGFPQVDYSHNNPVDPASTAFKCRDFPEGAIQATLTAGQSTTIKWDFNALHPGDCFLYLSYDAGSTWFKIANFPDCVEQDKTNVNVVLPWYLPSCEKCLLRWEWIALHLYPVAEFYAQCVDVKIIGSPTGKVPGPRVSIPGHVTAAGPFRNIYNPAAPTPPLPGPPLASLEAADDPQNPTDGNGPENQGGGGGGKSSLQPGDKAAIALAMLLVASIAGFTFFVLKSKNLILQPSKV